MARPNRDRGGRDDKRPTGKDDSAEETSTTDAGDEEFVEYDPDDDAATESVDEVDDDAEADPEVDDTDDDPEIDDTDDDDDVADERPASRGSRDLTKKKTSRRHRGRTETAGPLSSLGGGGGRTGRGQAQQQSRRARLAGLEAQHQRQRRARIAGLVGLCIVLALAVLAYPVYLYVDDAVSRATPRTSLGVPVDQAGCLPDESNPALGNQQHVDDGTVVQYQHLPPDSGPHYNQWAAFGQKFYDTGDRPEVERLVHNLEHGYTLVWYDADTIPDDDLRALRSLAGTFDGQDPSTNKFIAAPWSPTNDGGSFPEGTQIVATRWTADPENPGDAAAQQGVRMACAKVSGQAISDFMAKYPVTNSPEPNGG